MVCMFPMQIQGTAPQDGFDISLAEERWMVEIYGLRKVPEGFPLTIRFPGVHLLAALAPGRRKVMFPNGFHWNSDNCS